MQGVCLQLPHDVEAYDIAFQTVSIVTCMFTECPRESEPQDKPKNVVLFQNEFEVLLFACIAALFNYHNQGQI